MCAFPETTVNLIANAALTLLDDSVPVRRAFERPEELIEETLRPNGPVNVATLRYVAEPIPAGKHMIAPGVR